MLFEFFVFINNFILEWDIDKLRSRIFFEKGHIEYDGIPFSIIGTLRYDCVHGPLRQELAQVCEL